MRFSWFRYVYTKPIIGLLAAPVVAGCGMTLPGPLATPALYTTECAGAGQRKGEPVDDFVVLDWSGGISPIYPDHSLRAVDLELFETTEGNTLADYGDSFREDVRKTVAQIYCQSSPIPILVLDGDQNDYEDVTIVHITQELPPHGGTDVGEGEYDPCNKQRDNAAILFGERLLSLGDAFSYEEWVNIFANICAHEIGHTLGYGHISRESRPDTGRSLYVELMLEGHTMAELRRAHRFVATDHTNCPLEHTPNSRAASAVEASCSTP